MSDLDGPDLLPSDVFYPLPLTRTSTATATSPFPLDDLAPLRADSELARQLAAALTLRRAVKPRPDAHSFFQFGPPVHPPPPPPALFSPRSAGEVLGQGCFENFAASHHHVDRRPFNRFQLPAKPVRAQAEESGSSAKSRARAQTGAATARGRWTGSRRYGGTGVFLPRVVNKGDDGREAGMQGGGGEKQKQQRVRGLPLARQAMIDQHPPEPVLLPQDWSY